MIHPAIGLIPAYLGGSIPFAYLAGRARGMDLREHGSRNLGATNAARVLGWKIGLVVFALDTLKGALPVLFLPRAIPTAHPELWAIAYGVAAIAGHVKPIWLRGAGGGKGVATAAGVFLALAPIPTVVAIGVFLSVFLASGYVSLGSLSAAVVLPLALLVTRGTSSPIFAMSVVIAAFVFFMHRANIDRLRRGEENRFGRKRAAE